MSSAVNFLKDAPVKKSITVKASAKHAFEVFTAGFDTWWPRSHHIGKAPLKKAIMEGHIGGRCYSEQTDGTECDWGRITTLGTAGAFCDGTAQWDYQPDVMKSSEVDVRFTPESDGTTRVDLEHRHFERIGAGWESMREWSIRRAAGAARCNSLPRKPRSKSRRVELQNQTRSVQGGLYAEGDRSSFRSPAHSGSLRAHCRYDPVDSADERNFYLVVGVFACRCPARYIGEATTELTGA